MLFRNLSLPLVLLELDATMRFSKPQILVVLILLAISAPTVIAQDTRVLTVEEATAIGVRENSQLRTQTSQLALAGRQFDLQFRAWLPQVDLTFSNTDSVTINGPDNHNLQLRVSLKQPVFDGGKSEIQAALQSQALELQRGQLETAEFQLRSQIWTSYFQILVQSRQLELLKENFIWSTDQFKILEVQASQGSITELELLESEISIKQTELDISNRELELNAALFSFKLSLGIEPDQPVHLVDNGIENYSGLVFPLSRDQMTSIALNENLEYRSQFVNLRQAREQLELLKRTFIPTISLDLSFGVSGASLPLTTPNFSFGLSFQFDDPQFPVQANYSGGNSGAESRNRSSSVKVTPFAQITRALTEQQATMGIRQILETIAQIEKSLPFQIVQILETYENSKRSLALQRDLLDLESKKFEIAKLRHEQGEITLADLIRAQTDLTSKRLGLLQSIMGLISHEQQIAAALGLSPEELQLASRQAEESR